VKLFFHFPVRFLKLPEYFLSALSARFVILKRKRDMMKKLFTFLAALLFMGSAFAETFAEKDADKDGKVTLEEFAGEDKKLKRAFKKLDKDKDKALSEEEFNAKPAKKEKKGKKKKKDAPAE
jgi:hypothetical protein